jgi:hypothetical protein
MCMYVLDSVHGDACRHAIVHVNISLYALANTRNHGIHLHECLIFHLRSFAYSGVCIRMYDHVRTRVYIFDVCMLTFMM